MERTGEGVPAGGVRRARVLEEARAQRQVTVRSLVIGAVGSALISVSSMYVALKMGALPWPIVFTAIASLLILKALGDTNLHEVNVTHTAMSAGAMVAGGLAFTVPGAWIAGAGEGLTWVTALLATLVGVTLGLIFTVLSRRRFVVERQLAFPIGEAAAQTMQAGDEGGRKARVLFGSLGVSGVFTWLRDSLGAIPTILFGSTAVPGVSLGLYASPMVVAVGFMVGVVPVAVWFLGALLGDFGVVAGGSALGLWDAAGGQGVKSSLGIGLMIGCGVGIVLKNLVPYLASLRATGLRLPRRSAAGRASSASAGREVPSGAALSPEAAVAAEAGRDVTLRWAPLAAALSLGVLSWGVGLGVVASLVCMLGTWVAVSMAAQAVGDTGIDPMEIFAVIVLLAARALVGLGGAQAFLLAAVVAVACGLAGDLINDFKAGYLLRTSPRAQWAGAAVGAFVGAGVAVAVLFVIAGAYGTGAFGAGQEFLAAQASTVAAMVSGVASMPAFVCGLLVGCVLYLLGVPSMMLGLGVYLPFYMSAAAAVGALARLVCERVRPGVAEGSGMVVASGVLGGEAVVGVLVAIVALVGGVL